MLRTTSILSIATLCFLAASPAEADRPELLNVWPALAPAETESNPGTALPLRAADNPPITRVENITRPTLEVFPATNPSGAAVLILPGGGFRYVVPDLEGSEAAPWLNQLGITTIVLRYRTTVGKVDQPWLRPLQDSQRAIRLIRSQAKRWKIDPAKIGLLGFSAGGQVGAIHLTSQEAGYDGIDNVDSQSCVPNFGILIYPWNIYDKATSGLISPIQINPNTPATFLVHTHDDQSTSLGAVMFYAGLKKFGISSELHVYQNGGHGYGTRQRPNSAIGSWTDRCSKWLQIRELTAN